MKIKKYYYIVFTIFLLAAILWLTLDNQNKDDNISKKLSNRLFKKIKTKDFYIGMPSSEIQKLRRMSKYRTTERINKILQKEKPILELEEYKEWRRKWKDLRGWEITDSTNIYQIFLYKRIYWIILYTDDIKYTTKIINKYIETFSKNPENFGEDISISKYYQNNAEIITLYSKKYDIIISFSKFFEKKNNLNKSYRLSISCLGVFFFIEETAWNELKRIKLKFKSL